ncbi:MAG TPA: hypothetical protein V6D21_03090 [Candidatus Obscuribacterales bacterium]
METSIDADESGITIGIDDAGFSASISSSGVLSLGIGVAGVDIDLSNPNNSSIDFAFGLFSIEGQQEGCQVVLTYYIAGVRAMAETRVVPDCTIDDPEPPPEPPPKGDDEVNETPLIPNPYERFRAVAYPKSEYYFTTYFSTDINYFRHQTSWELSERSSPNIFYNPDRGWDFSINCQGQSYDYYYHVMNGIAYIINGEDEVQPGGCWRDINYKYPFPFMAPSWYREKEINGRPEAGFDGIGYQINAVIVRDLKSFSRSQSWSGENSKATEITRIQWDIYYEQITNKVPDVTKIPPLYHNKKPKMDDNCCEMIEEIYEVLQPRKFPFKLPESLRNIGGNEPKETDIDDYPEVLGYFLDRIDELIGQFDIDIEIQDTDPTTKGNQTTKIYIGNISEGIAEIIGLIYGLGMSQKIGTEAAVKSLISLGMVQKVVTEIDAVTEEIFDHLEIPMKEVEREIDLEFSPGVKNFDAFFKPSKERVKVPERLKGKNAPTLQDQLDVLIQAATIIKSRGFKKVDPYQDIGAQVVGNLASGLLDKYVLNNSDNPNNPPDPNKKSDFDEFIDDVQENFKKYEKPGEIDLEKSDNPKIIKLEKPTPTPKPTN